MGCKLCQEKCDFEAVEDNDDAFLYGTAGCVRRVMHPRECL